jgi:hypothetical protein
MAAFNGDAVMQAKGAWLHADSLINNAHFSTMMVTRGRSDQSAALPTPSDIRYLGAVPDHEDSCLIQHAIKRSSVGGSSARRRQVSLGLLCIDVQHIKRIGEFVRHLHAPFPSRLELAV